MPAPQGRSSLVDCASAAPSPCRGDHAPQRDENPANLTARELEVLALVAQGLRNAEIADRLFLAQKTVDSHVSAILRKLDVPTRGHASAEAVRLGLTGQDQ